MDEIETDMKWMPRQMYINVTFQSIKDSEDAALVRYELSQ